jgi:hypothetical protein
MRDAGIIAALVALVGIAPPREASAALMIEVTGPAGVVVEEGGSGTIDFIILFGDMNDELFRTTLKDPNKCVNMVLMPGQQCVFQQQYETRDLNKPMSGQNEGVWQMLNRVDFHETTNPANKDLTLGSTQVHVTDPIIVPEPATLIPAAVVALAGLGFGRRCRVRYPGDRSR